jgi:N-acetylmuramoyl-L-alanine amidase
MRKIDKIVIHCADVPDTMDIGASEIRAWHIKKGWNDIGYHYVIRRDGTTERGRIEDVIGAHVSGHNLSSIGICLVGRKDFDSKQLSALQGMLKALLLKYNLKIPNIVGHYELDSGKTCPNISMPLFRTQLSSLLDPPFTTPTKV